MDKNHRLGFVNVLLVLLVIALAILLSGAFYGKNFEPGGTPLTGSTAYACCDTGNGDACKPQEGPGQTFNFGGQEYGLLKTNITLLENSGHLENSGQTTPTGDPIILNNSEGFQGPFKECGDATHDQVFSKPIPPGGIPIETLNDYCAAIPNDEIIYVCKTSCTGSSDIGHGKFDVYFRLSDKGNIPDVIKNCTAPDNTAATPGEGSGPTIVMDQQPERINLQLQTFKVISTPGSTPWLSPFCKPAVYLYPPTTSYVTVKVDSSQPFTYTDPIYPPQGWGVIADPTGLITYQSKPYDYLYYETKAADSAYSVPDKGFVVDGKELASLFGNILPKLGLNIRETQQFSDYWVKALPESKYYFVGIVPQQELSDLTSLTINPKPTTEIRVTLYFKALNEKINVTQPVISTPSRTGFTVVEWGGIYKRDKDSKFSCYQ